MLLGRSTTNKLRLGIYNACTLLNQFNMTPCLSSQNTQRVGETLLSENVRAQDSMIAGFSWLILISAAVACETFDAINSCIRNC